MTKKTTTDRCIEALIASIRAEVRQEVAAEIAGTPTKGARRPKSSPEEMKAREETLFNLIKRKPGQGITTIAAEMGVSSKELMLPMRKLLAAKRIMKKGSRRATKYWVKK